MVTAPLYRRRLGQQRGNERIANTPKYQSGSSLISMWPPWVARGLALLYLGDRSCQVDWSCRNTAETCTGQCSPLTPSYQCEKRCTHSCLKGTELQARSAENLDTTAYTTATRLSSCPCHLRYTSPCTMSCLELHPQPWLYNVSCAETSLIEAIVPEAAPTRIQATSQYNGGTPNLLAKCTAHRLKVQ